MKNGTKLILIIFLPFLACSSVQSQKKSSEKTSYLDYKSLRPDFPHFSLDSVRTSDSRKIPDSVFIRDNGYFMINNNFSDSLVVLMDTLSRLNRSVPYYGYRIVLYTGSDRQRAIYERGKAMKLLDDDTEIYMNYQRPYFKVKVGNFYDRITAYATFLKLKKDIPTALLVPDIIDLDKIQFK